MLELKQGLILPEQQEEPYIPTEEGTAAVSLSLKKENEELRREGVINALKAKESEKADQLRKTNSDNYMAAVRAGNEQAIQEAIEAQRQAAQEAAYQAKVDGLLSYADGDPVLRAKLEESVPLSEAFAEGDLFIADRREMNNHLMGRMVLEELEAGNDSVWEDILDVPEVFVEAVANFFTVDSGTEDFVRLNSQMKRTLSPAEYSQFLKASVSKMRQERFFDNEDRILSEFNSLLYKTTRDAEFDDHTDTFFAALDVTGLGLGKLAVKGGKAIGGAFKSSDEIAPVVKKAVDDATSNPKAEYQFFDDAGKEITKDEATEIITKAAASGVKPRIKVKQRIVTAGEKIARDIGEVTASAPAQKNYKTAMGATDDVVDDAQKAIESGKSSSFNGIDEVLETMSVHDDILETLDNSGLPVKLREGIKEVVGKAKDILKGIPASQTEKVVRDFIRKSVEEGSELSIKEQTALNKVLSKGKNPTEVSEFKLAVNEEGLPVGYSAKVVKPDGSTYSRQEAELLQKEIGTKYDSEIVGAVEGGFMLNVNIGIPDLSRVAMQKFDIHRAGFLSRLLSNPTDVIDRNLHNLFRGAENELAVVEAFASQAAKQLRRMSKKEQEELSRFLEQSLLNGEEVWFHPNELTRKFSQYMGKNITDTQLSSYYVIRELNDMSYHMANKAIRDIREFKGYSQWDITRQDGSPWLNSLIAKHATKPAESTDVVFDASRNNATTGSQLTPERMAELQEQGFGVFKLETSSMRTIAQFLGKERAEELFGEGGSAIVSHAILPLQRARQTDLPLDSLPYVGGPRIMYDAPFVVKVGRTRNTPSTLGDFKQKIADVALFSSRIRGAGANGVKALQKIQQTLKKADKGEITEEMADEILSGLDMKGLRGLLDFQLPSGTRVAFNSLSGARRAFDEFGIQSDDAIQLVRDGQATELSSIGVANPLAGDGEALAAVKNNSRFQQRTDRRLRDIEGEVPLMNLMESTNRSFEKMTKFAKLEQVKELWANGFMKNYVQDANYLDLAPNATIREALEAKVKRTVDGDKRQEIIAQQNFVKQVIGFEAVEEGVIENLGLKLADWIFDKATDSPFEAFGNSTAKTITRASQGDLISLLKQYTFHTKLGLFRVDNMLQQTMTGMAAVAISPRFAPQAFKTAFHFNVAMGISKNGTDLRLVREYAKKVKKEVGEVDDFVESFREFIALGGNNYSSSIQEIATNSSGKITSGFMGRFAHVGSAAFRAGDRTSRMMTYAIARAELKAGKALNSSGKVIRKTDSDEAATYMVQRMQDLGLGFSRADVQEIARGRIGGAALQFMSYPMRMLGVFTGRTLTAGEKARLAGFYVATAGAGGIPLATTMLNYLEARHNLDESASKLAYNGLLDSFMLEMFGADTDFAGSVAAGKFVDDYFEDLLQANMAEVLGGASLSTVASGFNVLKNEITKFHKAGADIDEVISETTAKFLKNQIVSLSRLEKAYIGWKMGEVLDKKGDPQFNVNKKEAILSLAGFRFGKQQELSYLYGLQRSDRSKIDMYRKYLAELQNKRWEAHQKSDLEEVGKLDRQIHSVLETLKEENENVQKGAFKRIRPRKENKVDDLREKIDRVEDDK